jgi:ABC-type nitrate/sulfonate/bicarbonate transport system ATPase subunit
MATFLLEHAFQKQQYPYKTVYKNIIYQLELVRLKTQEHTNI